METTFPCSLPVYLFSLLFTLHPAHPTNYTFWLKNRFLSQQNQHQNLSFPNVFLYKEEVPSPYCYIWGEKRKPNKQKQTLTNLPNSPTIYWALDTMLGASHFSRWFHCLNSPYPGGPPIGSVHAEATPILEEDQLHPLFLLGAKSLEKVASICYHLPLINEHN